MEELKRCLSCERVLVISCFRLYKEKYLQTNCKKCEHKKNKKKNKGYAKKKRREDPKYRLWYRARAGARLRGLEFSITPDDVPMPEMCVYLGTALDYSWDPVLGFKTEKAPVKPTLDRIDNTKGYVVGNIQVISHLANCMKSVATSEQLIAFARGVLSQLQ